MNYKQKALDHVRSVCPELKCSACDGDGILIVPDPNDPSGNTPMQEQCNYCGATGMANTPHLEHWLRGLDTAPNPNQENIYGFSSDGVLQKESRTYGHIEEIAYCDLTKDGENQSEEFYRAYCEIVGIMNLK